MGRDAVSAVHESFKRIAIDDPDAARTRERDESAAP
jgi:hypothetical protein